VAVKRLCPSGVSSCLVVRRQEVADPSGCDLPPGIGGVGRTSRLA